MINVDLKNSEYIIDVDGSTELVGKQISVLILTYLRRLVNEHDLNEEQTLSFFRKMVNIIEEEFIEEQKNE